MRNSCKISVGKNGETDILGDLERKVDHNIKVDLKEIMCEYADNVVW